MITIFVLELSAGISGYVLRNEAGQMLKNNLATTMKEYQNYTYISALWDEVQQDVRTPNTRSLRIFSSIFYFTLQFTCCGLESAKDWIVPIGGVPVSCCAVKTGFYSN